MSEAEEPSTNVSERTRVLNRMVLSASGFRGVFGEDEHALSPSISPPHRDIVAMIIACWGEMLHGRTAGREAVVVVGTDTRPTGPAIADTVLRTLLTTGPVQLRWLGVAAAPEIMAYTARLPEVDAFVYVSASHNPPGHNGLKIGWADGGVMEREDAAALIRALHQLHADQPRVTSLIRQLEGVEPRRLEVLEEARPAFKQAALASYATQALLCGAGGMNGEQYRLQIAARLDEHPLGVVAELNGSARCLSIDRSFLPSLGAVLALHNDRAGRFAHQILPEGEGLTEAAALLKRYWQHDERFQLAYVPDNDGDRGNLVFLDAGNDALLLDAQVVFSLVVLIELAWLRYIHDVDSSLQDRPASADGTGATRETNGTPEAGGELIVVANGPTSCRVDRICRMFGARVVRAEVGEANVVHAADLHRARGAKVVILGEGSNGGSIVPPARVRDPINTVQSVLKLQAFRLADVWQQVSGQSLRGASLAAVAESLPRYQTLTTDDPRAKMQVGTIPHGRLKAAWEAQLPEAIRAMQSRLETAYSTALRWRLVNYEGTGSTPGPGNRSGSETGGLRLEFVSGGAEELPRAWVWMRGSGTEPVFRVLAECEGEDQQLLDELIDWHRNVIEEAINLL